METSVAQKIQKHFSQYPQREYAKGQILVHAGDDAQYVFFLEMGRVRQYDISYRGDEVIVNLYKSGTFFPMLGAMTKIPNKYFFEAETDLKVRLAPPEETVDFLRSNPDVLYDLLTRVYRGMDGILQRMVLLMSASAKNRLIYELVVECHRFGEKDKDGSCTIHLTEGDLAARAGLSRETVSREIRKICEDGFVTAKHNTITVKNLARLEQKYLNCDRNH